MTLIAKRIPKSESLANHSALMNISEIYRAPYSAKLSQTKTFSYFLDSDNISGNHAKNTRQ
jgi:hypothetical protein